MTVAMQHLSSILSGIRISEKITLGAESKQNCVYRLLTVFQWLIILPQDANFQIVSYAGKKPSENWIFPPPLQPCLKKTNLSGFTGSCCWFIRCCREAEIRNPEGFRCKKAQNLVSRTPFQGALKKTSGSFFIFFRLSSKSLQVVF